MLGTAVVKWLRFWLAETEVRGSIHSVVATISEIGYLLLLSRDIADISLERHIDLSSTQPTNQASDVVVEIPATPLKQPVLARVTA